ncbi:MAG TPA: hypothetical protein VLC94_09495 [Candidatus Acidoferrum sp.]|nr:hypothetical protein [Candidatus Acidoferrum sp.]
MRHRSTTESWKLLLGTGLLAGGMALFVGAPSAKADDCQERIVKADHRVHEAVEHHGWKSREAERAREELRSARSYCWEHSHKWWDVEGNRWRTERDWDDHDHDRDHDRDHDH